MKRGLLKLIALIIAASLTAAGCTPKETSGSGSRIAIAEQYGLAYAPLQIVKELKLLEKNLPGTVVEWKQLGNTAAIREAMLAGEVDAGFMAIPPFLIGWDKGMPWKIACGLSKSPVGLVTNREEIRSLRDFGDKDRIAVPQPGSVQHILLSMACEKELGDPHKLDNQLVTLAHPEGMSALLSGRDITAHFTAPPYLMKELAEPGMHEVLNGRQAMGGDFTFIAGVTTAAFHDKDPRAYKAFVRSIQEAIDYINNNREKAAAILAEAYKMPEAELLSYLLMEDAAYTTVVEGIEPFAQFMERNGYISKVPGELNEIVWEDVHDENP